MDGSKHLISQALEFFLFQTSPPSLFSLHDDGHSLYLIITPNAKSSGQTFPCLIRISCSSRLLRSITLTIFNTIQSFSSFFIFSIFPLLSFLSFLFMFSYFNNFLAKILNPFPPSSFRNPPTLGGTKNFPARTESDEHQQKNTPQNPRYWYHPKS